MKRFHNAIIKGRPRSLQKTSMKQMRCVFIMDKCINVGLVGYGTGRKGCS
jgi:hypothetical protein